MSQIKIGIIGATGYTGSELVYLLTNHDQASVDFITSESYAGQKFSEVHSQFKGIADQPLASLDELENQDLDVVFLGLPHGVSMDFVKEHGYKDFKVIDLSGDFRLPSAEMYNKWYPKEHVYPEGYEDAVYGLPELFREEIKEAQLIANPGCYPTSVILPLSPLMKEDLVQPNNIVADAKSGVTGAGAKAKQKTHFPNINDNFSAYGLKHHRHTPEMQSAIKKFSGQATELLFTPHLLPVNRGILSTIYAAPQSSITDKEIRSVYQKHFKDEPFIRVLEEPPTIQEVRGSNYCNIFSTYDERTQKILTIACIDNLVKGAAGQAVQNMNIVFGFNEHEGLTVPPLKP